MIQVFQIHKGEKKKSGRWAPLTIHELWFLKIKQFYSILTWREGQITISYYALQSRCFCCLKAWMIRVIWIMNSRWYTDEYIFVLQVFPYLAGMNFLIIAYFNLSRSYFRLLIWDNLHIWSDSSNTFLIFKKLIFLWITEMKLFPAVQKTINIQTCCWLKK